MTDMFANTETAEAQEIAAFSEKYKNDPIEMAKALAHANKFIDTLKQEKAAESAKVLTMEQLRNELKTPQGNNTPTTPAATAANPQSNVLDENTLNEKVEELWNKKTQAIRDGEAQALIQSTLLAKFGSAEKARQEIVNKANDLGMTPEELQKIGIRSPKALFNMFGIDGNKPVTSAAPHQSTVNVNARQHSNPVKDGNKLSEYTGILREDNGYRKYMSPSVQKEIMAEAMKNPAAFGINV